MVEQRKRIRRGWNGRFEGFRLNCEQIPLLPALVIRWAWDDPRRIRYLLTGSTAAMVALLKQCGWLGQLPALDYPRRSRSEIKQTDGTAVSIYLFGEARLTVDAVCS